MKREDKVQGGWDEGAAGQFMRGVAGPAAALPRMPIQPLAALLDELAFGVAIVDAGCRLIHATRAARIQLQSSRGLRLFEEAIETEVETELDSLRRAVAGAIAGRRSYLAFGSASGKLDIAILPLELPGLHAPPVAALVFEKCAGSGGLGLYFFAQAYGLTRAEQCVLTELCDGSSVIEAATRLGSSVHTARTHVRNILVKTGQPNLRGLIRRIGMLPPVGARFAIAHARDEALAVAPRGRRGVAAPSEVPAEASGTDLACVAVV